MTSWGGYDNHLRVGIDWTISPANPGPSDTTVDVTWKFYVGSDGWGWIGDNQTLHEGADGWGGTTTNYVFNTSGSKLVDTVTRTYAISTNSGNVHANANVTGAYNSATPSHSVTVSLPDRPNSTPDAPSGLNNSGISTSGFTANWTNGSGNGNPVDQVQLQWDNNSGFTSPTSYNPGSVFNNHAVTGLTPPGSTWYWRVRCHNSAGWGPWSGTGGVNLTAAIPSTPAAPTVGTRTSPTSTTATLQVKWAAPANNGAAITGYRVELSTSATLVGGMGSAFATVTASHTGNVLSYTFTGLNASTTYYAHVYATNSQGNSLYSPVLTAATIAVPQLTDTGDYVTLVNNLAQAVASKLAHLGTFVFRGKTASVSIPDTTITYLDLGSGVETCPLPDPPTYSSNATSAGCITIAYPGTYQIEFAACMPGNTGTASSLNLLIAVNTDTGPDNSGSNGRGGIDYAGPWSANEQSGTAAVTIVRRLVAGDTLAFGIRQASGGAVSTQTFQGSDLTCYARVTMIGF